MENMILTTTDLTTLTKAQLDAASTAPENQFPELLEAMIAEYARRAKLAEMANSVLTTGTYHEA
ncbi:hypothetical protein [Mesorhizobium sp. DCY119]|uniref:hypothetical protein n=1 Tax=Mesorhizobium sp. DCY119 TaxID=2108445 RepID=UPI000E739406|nr:hypothetical protein [Mesorhizobium sp. DCY119]RJG45467.1 hypothetical protein D3Y55_15185 [Mesorhizobium sp. DCY119]